MFSVARKPQAPGSARYSAVAIALHWTIATAIVLQITLAYRMLGPPTPTSFAVMQLHKSIGITILLLSLVRLAMRIIHPPPPLPADLSRWERMLSKTVHWAFYVIMIGMPLTGWIMVSASRITVPTLLYGVVPWPNLPGLAGLAPAAKHAWHDVGENGHGLLAYGLFGLLALHVAGALKHQLFGDHDPILARMAPGARPGRVLEPRLAVILLAALGVIGFGEVVTPPGPRMAPAAEVAAAPPTPEPLEAQAPGEPAPNPSAPTPVAATASADPAPAGPAKWIVQPGSTLGFTSAWSSQPVHGRFDRWRADILFSPEALDRSKVTVTIDVGSVNTGDQQRDGVLPSADWFDAAAHPKAVFTASRFEKIGPDRYVAHGTLQLKGASKPQDLAFRLKIQGAQAEVAGSANLDRTAFGVGQGEFAATDQIPGKVTVDVTLKAKRAS